MVRTPPLTDAADEAGRGNLQISPRSKEVQSWLRGSKLFQLRIEKARNLAWCKFGASNPYVKMFLRNRFSQKWGLMRDTPIRKQVGRTRTIKQNLDPIWAEQFTLSVDPSYKAVLMEVWDENIFLHQVVLRIEDFVSSEGARRWLCVQDLRGRSEALAGSGSLQVQVWEEAEIRLGPAAL